MSVRASRPCPQPGCANLQPCTTHPPRAPFSGRPGFRARGYSADHDAHRRELWRDGPPPCARGCGRCASALDHILALAEGGKDVRENREPLCPPCHDAKTAAEAARGRSRAWRPPEDAA